MVKNKSINIVQIEAKDIVNAGSGGYIVKSLKRYKGTFDYSLEWIKLKREAERILRKKNVTFKSDVETDEKLYTDLLVSVTFKYKTEELGRSALREKLYKEGFILDGKKYVRFKRSSGSSRVGKCLFIREELHNCMAKWSYMGLKFKDTDEMDLASMEAYIALTTSSIIDTMEIQPHEILVIDDYTSSFEDETIAVKVGKDNLLEAKRERVTVSNSIWDGQSLMDISLFGKYEKKGMLLLRNRFFKSCCFNCNIQKFFRDNNITDISQLNGWTRATEIEDIKLITTPSSIKYLKFGSIDSYFDQLESTFGVVKYDKPTHYMNGELVQSHYQLLNTLEMTYEDTEVFLKDTIDYVRMLKQDTSVMRWHLKMNIENRGDIKSLSTSNDFIYAMLMINDDISMTNMYNQFKTDLIKTYINNTRSGHVFINGNYSTLMGNGLEMLKASVGMFDGTSSLPVGSVMNKNFDYNKRLLGSRSPHVTMGNLWLMENIYVKDIDKYFNLSKQIICINSIGDNVLERLNGCDFDSDTLLLTDHPLLIRKAEENYHNFLVPTSMVESKKTKRYNTAWHKYDLDEKTSVNKIGEIINLSQILNSRLWELKKQGLDITDIYNDICKLAVLSCIEIDRAKKEFVISSTDELKLLREKYSELIKEKPMFFYHLPKDEQMKANSDISKHRKYETTMDYLEDILNEIGKRTRTRRGSKKDFSELFSKEPIGEKRNINQINKIIDLKTNYSKKANAIWLDENMSKSEKYLSSIEAKEEYVNEIKKMKINPATIKSLLMKFESTSQRHLASILFSTHKESFMKLLSIQMEEIDVINRSEDGDIYIYGKGFCKDKAF